jgi:hypothetical protein
MNNIDDKIREKGKLLPSLYYINEKGLLVFTEEYHLQRGHCCGKTCKHCPFEPVGIKGNTNVRDDLRNN